MRLTGFAKGCAGAGFTHLQPTRHTIRDAFFRNGSTNLPAWCRPMPTSGCGNEYGRGSDHLIRGRRLQPPPVQCEVLCAFRHRQPLCELTVLRERASRSATRSAIQWQLDPRPSAAAILLAGIGKYFRTRGLRVAKVVLRFSTHRELRSGRPPPVQAVAADFRQYAPGKYRLSGSSNRKVQYKSTRG